jgi:hypothetical protein
MRRGQSPKMGAENLVSITQSMHTRSDHIIGHILTWALHRRGDPSIRERIQSWGKSYVDLVA